MLAILGMIGVAISALVVMDSENAEDEFAGETNGDTQGAGNGPVRVVPISNIVFADELDATEGNDTLNMSDAGSGPMFAQGGDDYVAGGTGDDYINGEDGNDILQGGDGADELHGGRDDDHISGGAGGDTLVGHVGNDTLIGDGGDDLLQGGSGDDTLDGGEGNDTLQGYLGNDTLISGKGSDTLFGGAGDDMLDGEDDDYDYLNGGDGSDRLVGGLRDNMNGGTGDDVFVMREATNTHIDDFSADEDTIEVLYDGQVAPVLSTSVTDGGLALLADGEVVTTLAGVETLDLNRVTLIAA